MILTTPISEEVIRSLHVGQVVEVSGSVFTGRDAVHRYLYDGGKCPVDMRGSAVYHCGPVVKQHDDGSWSFVAAGPTTSIREEVYQPDVIEHFNLKGVIGKGGMGPNTLKACQDYGAVYFHAIGGAASLIAQSVKEVVTVYKMEFGVPEAMWVIKVEDFPVVVTMDSHGESIHKQVEAVSKAKLDALIGA